MTFRPDIRIRRAQPLGSGFVTELTEVVTV